MPVKFHLGTFGLDDDLLARLWQPIARAIPTGASLLVHAGDRLAYFTALSHGAASSVRLIAAPSNWTLEQLHAEAERSQPDYLLTSRVDPAQLELQQFSPEVGLRRAIAPGVTIFTSGTTGTPKGVCHSWESIAASGNFVPQRLQQQTWYLAYEPAGFAGLQVIFSALRSGGPIVVPRHGTSFREHSRLIVARQVQVISATPTWWRLLVAAWCNETPPPALHQATLGGEAVGQPTIDLVDRVFKPEHLAHIYASSEVGTAIVVSDRQAGFPVEFLGDLGRRVQLRLRDGVLQVRSPFRMQGYVAGEAPTTEDGWLQTADLVEIRGGRCHFAGRTDDVVNVGGHKVAPEEVERTLRRITGVGECFVYGRQNPIVGTMLAADVLPMAEVDLDAHDIRRQLAQMLPRHKVPQYIRFVQEIPVSASGKKQRH